MYMCYFFFTRYTFNRLNTFSRIRSADAITAELSSGVAGGTPAGIIATTTNYLPEAFRAAPKGPI